MTWKIGVAENTPSLHHEKKYFSSLSANEAVGSTTLNVTGSTHVDSIIQNNIVMLGPSSSSSNPGATEFCRVSSTTSSTIVVEDSLDYAYLSGDLISGIGSGLSEGWGTDESGLVTITTNGINLKTDAEGSFNQGKMDRTNALLFDIISNGAGSAYVQIRLGAQLHLSVTYRAVCWIMQPNLISFGDSSATFSLYHNDDRGNQIGSSTSIEATTSSFTKYEILALNEETAYSATYFHPMIEFAWTRISNALGNMDAIIGGVYLMHASEMSGSAQGYIEFATNPVDMIRQDVERNVTRLGIDLSNIYPMSITQKSKRQYRLRFDDVSLSFLKDLELLTHWQELGYRLLLEPDVDDQMPVLGMIDFSIRDNHWDVENMLAVDLIFRGE